MYRLALLLLSAAVFGNQTECQLVEHFQALSTRESWCLTKEKGVFGDLD